MNKETVGEYVKYGCTFLIVATFCGLLFLVMSKTIPKENEQTANLMLGALGTMTGTIISYWWGSSAGSAAHAKTLSEIVNTTIPIGGAISQSTTTEISKDAVKPVVDVAALAPVDGT